MKTIFLKSSGIYLSPSRLISIGGIALFPSFLASCPEFIHYSSITAFILSSFEVGGQNSEVQLACFNLTCNVILQNGLLSEMEFLYSSRFYLPVLYHRTKEFVWLYEIRLYQMTLFDYLSVLDDRFRKTYRSLFLKLGLTISYSKFKALRKLYQAILSLNSDLVFFKLSTMYVVRFILLFLINAL